MSIDRDFPAEAGTTNITRRDALMAGTAAAVSRFAVPAGLSGALAGLAGVQPAAAQPSQPNIVYVVVDDMGFADVGFNGSDIKTPNLDKLAQEGAHFDQFYALPMCTPTRAALMTGRYPLRYGLQTGVIPAAGTYGLPVDEYLLPQALKDAGYKTTMVGKWHLGHAKPEFWPRQRGFDYFYGALVGEIDHFKHSSHGVKDWYRNNKPLNETGFDNTLFGNEAARVVEGHDGKKPLFLYLAFTAPHTPFQAPREYLDRFKGIADENRRKYAAMISVVDDGVGKLVAALEKKGMRDNTLIVFQSDNGGVKNSLFAGDSKISGELPASNAPFRDGKGTLYEGGTRVAALANWPGKIKPGVVGGMVHVVDMVPTLAALANAKLDKSKPLDGMNVWDTLSEGKPSPRNEVVYNIDPMAGAVRKGDWKLVWKASLPSKVELFNLAEDKVEAHDVAAANPDKVKDLQGRITELASEMVPPQLLMDAVRLIFFAPPVTADPSTLLSLGD
ncbi:arylsulfatase [Mesorhizobium sp.]|uniref:arylsulfatase B n=1 Tax=Mesorhizobium sp. TaxID=1871066 RepID=UPI000FE9FE5A|nr:arylsulfatase [Mesorhizobium sp.]RWC26039.1 MAG: sulfatase [Mesorhizobium sp.]TIX22663.1 MAG: arylsulfatase [Mesorhizobium sp.]